MSSRRHQFAVVVLLAGPAGAEEPLSAKARERMDHGLRLYEERRFDAALAEFRVGYAIDPRRDFLFAMAQAERLRGDCATAIDLYGAFLEREPPPAQADAAREMIARCEAARAAAAPPSPAPPSASPTPVARRAAAPPERGPWWRDVWGDALLGAGVVGLGVGAGLFVASSGARDDAGAAPSYEEYGARIDDARGQRTGAVFALTTGTVLVAAAIVRYALRPRADEAR